MICRVPVRNCLLSGIIPFKILDEDRVHKDSETALAFYKERQDSETGWDRLRIMYSMDEFGSSSPELHSSFQAAFLGMFVGACYGGFVRSRLAYLDFMERNQASVFKNHIEAKKKLQDQVTVNFAKGAFKWGWRLGFFSGSYVLISTSISVYRGKSSVWEYIIAGGVTGACYKTSIGYKGMLVGGLLGCCLGTFAGAISLGLLKATGMTMEEVRFWQYRWKESRVRQTQKMFKDYKAKDELPLLIHHNEKVGASGSNLEILDSPPQATNPQM